MIFDLVPQIKFQDAIELLSMQPITSTPEAWKRCSYYFTNFLGLLHNLLAFQLYFETSKPILLRLVVLLTY